MTKETIENCQETEKIFLVMVREKKHHSQWTIKDNLGEMKELIVACGGEVVDAMTCMIDKPTAGFLINEKKAGEIAAYCQNISVDTIIFGADLKGSQQRNLERIFKTRTIDRTQLILDIFAKHASSKEGKVQVELAQLEYLLPRLVGKGVELSRLGGGIGTLGPGETKLEIDRRKISQRIDRLKKLIGEVSQKRALTRKKRRDRCVPALSLVGYTNAGKSTLLNHLTEANQVTCNGYFTTLDPLSRQLVLPNHQKVILSDTVGFMHNLPHHLIKAFYATLEEVKEADVLLHVLDVSHEHFRNLYDSVNEVLKELESFEKTSILVLNKIDRLTDTHWLEEFENNFDHAVCVSAKTGEGIGDLLTKIVEVLSVLITEIDVEVPMDRMDLVSLAHEEGEVCSIKYYEKIINIRAFVPKHIAARFYK